MMRSYLRSVVMKVIPEIVVMKVIPEMRRDEGYSRNPS
jgi:hypothetical protein